MKRYAVCLLVKQNGGGVHLTPITIHLASDNGEAITEATNEFFSLNDPDSCVVLNNQSLLIEE
jgi:hypothetical protein